MEIKKVSVYNGKEIRYVLDFYESNFFQGEIRLPNINLKFDYFSEDQIFSEENIIANVEHFVTNIVFTLNDWIDALPEVLEYSKKFCSYNYRHDSTKENIWNYVIEPHMKSGSCFYLQNHWGRTLKSQIIDLLHNITIGEISHVSILELYSEETVKLPPMPSDYDRVNDTSLIDGFLLRTGYKNYKFKRLEHCPMRHRIPKEYIETCTADEYTLPQENRIPLMVMTIQQDYHPKITKEMMQKLEGQPVVVLIKSLYSGYEYAMELRRVINGEFQKIISIKREMLNKNKL